MDWKSTINRNVLHPLWAARNRDRRYAHLRLLERTQFDPPDLSRARQFVRLRALLDHAARTVPYYRALMRQLGITPADLRSFADFQRFPILSKRDVNRYAAELRSEAFARQPLIEKSTSGSTGSPVRIVMDRAALEWKAACTLRSDQWSGWRIGEPVAKVWGNPEYRHEGVKGRLRNWFFDRARYLDTLRVTDESLAAFARTAARHRPTLVFGHTHSVFLLAPYLLDHGITAIRPRGVITSAMVLPDWQRPVIEAAFGCRVTNRYGCEEVSLIACECEHHAGLHINEDSVYVEVKSTNDHPNVGSIVVTDLTNFAMPLIRYELTDIIELTDRVCPCGRGLRLIEKVHGREADYLVTPAGHRISGVSLTENFILHIPGVEQVQIIQEATDHLTLRVVPGLGFGRGAREKIEVLVRDLFGPGVRYTLEEVGRIAPEPSGKVRYCVSRVAG